jgi:hypothetical protein
MLEDAQEQPRVRRRVARLAGARDLDAGHTLNCTDAIARNASVRGGRSYQYPASRKRISRDLNQVAGNCDNMAQMPRWTKPPKHPYSPERLAFFRDANRRYRERLRGGASPMPHRERGILSGKVRRARKAEEANGL